MTLPDPRAAVARLMGVPALSAHPLGGAAYEVRLENQDGVLAKTDARPGAIASEVASLNWLAETRTVHTPRVREYDELWMVTDLIPTGRPDPLAAQDLGRQLARLHRSGAPSFGSPPTGGPATGTIGLAPMHNVEEDDWATFYAAHRVEVYLKMAYDAGSLSSQQMETIHRVAQDIDRLAGPPEPPARLHGDLWSGNLLWGADGRAWLIDPAAHGGHRETDLAMLKLFGAPQLGRIIDAYQQEYPLSAGWESRTGLHQLFPLVVHAALFGGGYAAQAESAAASALRAA
ncbi:MAG: fructosamine kinase family protein [Actinomycetota bacterium]